MSIIQYLTSINMIFGSHYTVREISKYFRNAHNLSMKSFYKSSNIFAHSLCIVYIYTRICICLIQLYVYIHIYVCIRMIRVWLITFPFQGTDAVLIALGIINADVNYCSINLCGITCKYSCNIGILFVASMLLRNKSSLNTRWIYLLANYYIYM